MNKENILRVANAIEKGELVKRGIGFNMALWCKHRVGWFSDIPDMTGHDCGTVACIGATAGIIFGLEDDEPRLLKKLGLRSDQRDKLFLPAIDEVGPWCDITTARAVAVLRHLAETGEVDWSVAS